ncbi:MAG: PepSY domain-containing protein [Bacteroidota bacterium]
MAKKRLRKLTKWMFYVHRYTGFVLSLLFLFWFASGFVMMYKSFPYLSRSESLERIQSIPSPTTFLEPAALIEDAAGLKKENIHSINIVSFQGRPVYRLQSREGDFHCFFADTGERIPSIGGEEATQIVDDFVKGKYVVQKVEPMHQLDQWTPRTRFLPYLPAYKVHLDDGKGTVCYVSSVTGEVFQKVNLADKIWAWLGAIPHWIYFKDLRIQTQLWRDVVVGISIVGVIMCIAGLYMGIIRVKRKKRKQWAFSPFKKVWFKWHHYTGFIFGLITFTWILSGLFSMNPWKWSPSSRLSKEAGLLWQGGTLNPEWFVVNPSKALNTFKTDHERQEVRLIEFIQFSGKPYYRANLADGTTRLFQADGHSGQWIVDLDAKSYLNQVQLLHPEAENLQITTLTDYDAYYYDKHRTKPLPVFKVDINDHANTSYYINPKTAEVLLRHENTSRLNRWLYHGLHSLDFPALFFRRPLWDIVMIVLMLGGTSVSVTGLVLTWKWIKRKIRKGKRLYLNKSA